MIPMASDESGQAIDHYVWEGYYIKTQYDSPQGRTLASTTDVAKQRVSSLAEIDDGDWKKTENKSDHSRVVFARDDTRHHRVVVVQRPVYAEVSADE
jgi:hypothetical protein